MMENVWSWLPARKMMKWFFKIPIPIRSNVLVRCGMLGSILFLGSPFLPSLVLLLLVVFLSFLSSTKTSSTFCISPSRYAYPLITPRFVASLWFDCVFFKSRRNTWTRYDWRKKTSRTETWRKWRKGWTQVMGDWRNTAQHANSKSSEEKRRL